MNLLGTKGNTAGLVIMAAIFGSVFLALTLYGLWLARKAIAVKSWPRVGGTLDKCELTQGSKDSYTVQADYSYTVNGVRYESSNIDFGYGGGRLASQKRLYDRLSQRKTIEVRYNPRNPGEATLLPGSVSDGVTVMMIIPAFFAVAALVVLNLDVVELMLRVVLGAASRGFEFLASSLEPSVVVLIFQCVFLIPLCLGVALMLYTAWSFWKSVAVRSWPQVRGKLESCELADLETGGKLAIRYSYVVDGQTYVSTRLAFGLDGADTSNAFQLHSFFLTQAEGIPVNYNPRRPEEAAVSFRRKTSLGLWLFGIGALVTVYGLQTPLPRQVIAALRHFLSA